MKSRTLMCITAAALLAVLAITIWVAAQEQQQKWKKEHARYRLIDVNTFGGPNSYVPIDPSVQRLLSEHGTISSCADTSVADPNFPNINPFLPSDFTGSTEHAFEWENGVLNDLGALPGGNNSCESWVSGNGLIAGESENGLIDPVLGVPAVNAVLWKEGRIINLGTLGGNESFAIGVNNRGEAVGAAANAIPDPLSFFGFGTQTRAFLWQNGVMQDLGTLGGPDAFAIAINDRGQVLGFSFIDSTPNPTTGQPTGAGFLWDHGKIQAIPDPLGGTQISPYRLNNRGQAVGSANLAGDVFEHTHPFLWENGVFTDLGTFGGIGGIAQEINEAGQIAGTAGLPGDMTFHGFLWENGVKSDLRPVGSDPCSQTYGMNSSGQVVGWSGYFCAGGNFGNIRAVLWDKSGSAIDLNTRIGANPHAVYLFAATNINDRGEIVGEGVLPNGDAHAFLLIPCDDEHANTEGCEGRDEDAAAAIQSTPAVATQAPATAAGGRAARNDRMAAIRARMMRRYRRFGMPQPSTK